MSLHADRSLPPLPNTFSIVATVRDLGNAEIPVARVEFGDVLGDTRKLDLDAGMAFNLAMELLSFVRQVGDF